MTGIDEKSLIKLVKACARLGVHSLEYQGIKIVMGEKANLPPTPSPAKGIGKKQAEVSDKAELQQQFDFAREHIETLHVEDPVAFEENLIRGEFGEESVRHKGTESTL